MRVGLISDVHGNRVALEAVLADMPPVDRLACAGDVVGYNPWHADCVDAMRERGVPTVMGNHDRAVAGGTDFAFNSMAGAGVRHAREALDDGQLEWLAALPNERTVCEGSVRLVHGHPADPNRYTYPAQFGPHLLDAEDVLVLGRTHVQHHERYEAGVVVNPGSVGQPRDGDPRAAYAVLDLDGLQVEERRVEYDIDEVTAAIASAGLPAELGERLREGR